MNLKEAIEWGERTAGFVLTEQREAFHAMLAAAKKQLAAEEASKPKRASLEEIERALRKAVAASPDSRPGYDGLGHDMVAAADILKALRETVVPWLRTISHHAVVGSVSRNQWDMLRALGEEP